jgi:serine/threonine protein phosphatase PrpC
MARIPESTQNITKEVATSLKKFDNCVTKFAFATKTGISPKNPYKVNQDQYLVMPHLGEYRRTHFFAVCDGHGVFGREVSEWVKLHLGKSVEQGIKQMFDQAKVKQRVVDSTEVKEQLRRSFSEVGESLERESRLNLKFSGSTCVSVLIVGTKIFCANVGDSRAVLVRAE